MRHATRAVQLWTILGVSALVTTANGDAVPPPPRSCPPGQVGVTSHSGPECVPKAPTDCAPGYRGRVGGDCVLATCSDDARCDAGERCLQVDTCQEYRELHWTGWGWSAQRPVSTGNMFAGPPSAQPPGPPKKAWVQLNICGQDGPCKSPAECRPTSLCYPTASIGKTKAKVAQPGSGDPSGSQAGSTPGGEKTYVQPPSPAQPSPDVADADQPTPDGGGCRKGCSTAAPVNDVGWGGLSAWMMGLLMWRRRGVR